VANEQPKEGADYTRHYSETGFWRKLARHAKAAGKGVVERALWLYYVARAPGVPLRVKALVLSALGYFIFPLDAVPDVLPLVGYSDDLGVLGSALALCAAYVTPAIKERARARLKALGGS
jgi:uncharacterized membrane protein YkvA (DUF1232 family)